MYQQNATSIKLFILMISSCDAAIFDERKELVCELGFDGLLQITCKQLNMGLCMQILQKINVVYYKLQLEGGPNIPLTCSNVQLVLGSPPSGRKLVLDTHCIREDCVPSIIKIEDLMVEIKNATEFHRLFIIFVCATLFALTMCLESHYALWHARITNKGC